MNTYKTPYIPYFQTTRYRVKAMVELAEAQSTDYIADLGSGDGRIVIAFAQNGIKIDGFELNDELIHISRKGLEIQQLTQYARIIKKDFWEQSLSSYSIITVYGMPDILEALEKKLHKELPNGAKVLSNYYPFPHWKIDRKKDNIYRYTITKNETV